MLGPKKLMWMFDVMFMVIYIYLGYYELFFFYVPAVILGFLGDIVLFNVFPMLDMPYIPWAEMINAWEKGEPFSGNSPNNLSINEDKASWISNI